MLRGFVRAILIWVDNNGLPVHRRAYNQAKALVMDASCLTDAGFTSDVLFELLEGIQVLFILVLGESACLGSCHENGRRHA